MDEKLKQRLIGGLVIAGSLCIILPFLFYNARPSAEHQQVVSALPNSAAPPTVSVALPAENAAATNSVKSAAANLPVSSSASTVANNHLQSPQAANSVVQNTSMTQQAPAQTLQTAHDVKTVQSEATAATQSVPEHKLNSNTIASHPEAAAAGFKPDQAVSPASGLTTGAPISSLPPSMDNATPDAKPEAASSHHSRENHVVAHHHAHATTKGKWEIQMAVFSDRRNAQKLIAKLHRKHIPAFARAVTHHGRHMTAVFAGPESTHAKTIALQGRLHHELRMNSMVKRA